MRESQNQAVETQDPHTLGKYKGKLTISHGPDRRISELFFISHNGKYEKRTTFNKDRSFHVEQVEHGIRMVADFNSDCELERMEIFDSKGRLEETSEIKYYNFGDTNEEKIYDLAYFEDGTSMEVIDTSYQYKNKPQQWSFMKEVHFDRNGKHVTMVTCDSSGKVRRAYFSDNGWCVKELNFSPNGEVRLITHNLNEVDSDGNCPSVSILVDPQDPYEKLGKLYGKTTIEYRDKNHVLTKSHESEPVILCKVDLAAWVKKLDIPTQSHPDRRGQRLATFSALFQPPAPAASPAQSATKSGRQGGTPSR